MVRKHTEAKLAEFRHLFPVGTPCIYYPIRPFSRDQRVHSKIRSEPWVLGHGAIVVAIEGKKGGVLIDHIVIDTGIERRDHGREDQQARHMKATAKW